MELEILHFIQSCASPFLDKMAEGVTMLGESAVLVVFMLLVYWLFDKEKGEYMILAALTSMFFNGALKEMFLRDRPIGQPGIRSLRTETATGASFPSGHAQNTASVLFSAAFAYKKKWLTALAVTVTVLVALSRLYLGVHWPTDVLAGVLLGVGISWAVYSLSYYNIFHKKSAFAIVAIALLIGALICRSADMAKSAGIACGAAIAVRLEHKYVRFSTKSSHKRPVLRLLVGMAAVAAVYLLPKLFLPETLIVYFFRYFLVAVTAMLACPFLFVKLAV